MNIFVIGKSKTGKTTVSSKIAQALDIQHVTVSTIFREIVNENDFETRQEFIEKISYVSETMIEHDPYVVVNYVNSMTANTSSVVEGFRNPFEFIKIFNPSEDKVVFLNGGKHVLSYQSKFENGVDLIYKNLKWMHDLKILKNFVEFKYNNWEELNQQIKDYIKNFQF